MEFTINDIRKIKLIIWDLDDTFWRGTLSSNGSDKTLVPIKENITLIHDITKRGIVNSICSKNDKEQAENKLKEYGILDYFVFNSISWEPKGQRIKAIIDAMSLRPTNVLYIDDNPSNLAEAAFIMPEIYTTTPKIIPEIIRCVPSIGKDDNKLSRLHQYKVLEDKHKDAEKFSSNTEFLKASNIRICIKTDVLSVIDRVLELIERTNQLNFTKKRISRNELLAIINDTNYSCGYVSVSDNYGEYGIIGFYALKDNKLEHFVFSCRTIGMGIEQFVYVFLDYPELIIVPPISGSVTKESGKPEYITQVDSISSNKSKNRHNNKTSILLKGPCDLQVMASYIESENIAVTKEFNFVDSRGNQADFYNHTVNILNSVNMSSKEKSFLVKKYSFLSEEDFQTDLFSGNYDVICLSPLMDATLAVYKDKITGDLFPYGTYSKPITESSNWKLYIDKKIMTAGNDFEISSLKEFSQQFEHIEFGPVEIVNNLSNIINIVRQKNCNTFFVILLLAELPFIDTMQINNQGFENKELLQKKINEQMREKYNTDDNVYLLDVNNYIKTQADYFDNINHYSKLVYYKMASEFVEVIGKRTQNVIKIKSKEYAWFMNIRRMIYKKFFLKHKK